jgi:hypothetical protein
VTVAAYKDLVIVSTKRLSLYLVVAQAEGRLYAHCVDRQGEGAPC